jgi:hypothetical protein
MKRRADDVPAVVGCRSAQTARAHAGGRAATAAMGYLPLKEFAANPFVVGMLSDISRFCFCFQVLVLFRDGAASLMRCFT